MDLDREQEKRLKTYLYNNYIYVRDIGERLKSDLRFRAMAMANCRHIMNSSRDKCARYVAYITINYINALDK